MTTEKTKADLVEFSLDHIVGDNPKLKMLGDLLLDHCKEHPEPTREKELICELMEVIFNREGNSGG